MSSQERDYYEILRVSRDASEQEIRDAYHKLAMKWHPDRNKSPEAEQRFKEIAQAYAILKDPKKRAQYDSHGMDGVAHYTPEDLFGDFDFGDLFGDMGFGFGGSSIFDRMFGRRTTRPVHGRDLRVRIEVPLDVIEQGGKESVRISHPATCLECRGYGTKSGEPPPLCKACQGTGRRVVTREEVGGGRHIRLQQLHVCPECHGKGTEITQPCVSCGGYGQIEREETIKVSIPAGIEDGTVLRVAGHGLPGDQPGSPPGDLHVAVYSKPDGRFQRRGADLWRTETIDIADAVLGMTLTVPTLQGKVNVTIPAGIQPDEVLRLRGKGLPRFNNMGQGDLNLRIQIDIPKKLSDKQRQLYQQLRELNAKAHQ